MKNPILISISILVILLNSCQNPSKELHERTPAIFKKKLIETNDLSQLLGHSKIKIIDLRPEEEYLQGHLPGAILVTRKDIEDTTAVFEGMMGTQKQMENLLSKLGINQDDFIVMYDGKGGPEACRLFWILNQYGHPHKAVLNGGFVAWNDQKRALNKKIPEVSTSRYRFSSQENKQRYASVSDVQKALTDENTCIIDSRSLDEYTGTQLKGKVERGGHIPKSIHIDYEDNINQENGFTFKSIDELKKLYAGIPKDKKVIVYCHSGVRSALTTYILTELLGYKEVKNYDGSWIEWSAMKNLPVETGTMKS